MAILQFLNCCNRPDTKTKEEDLKNMLRDSLIFLKNYVIIEWTIVNQQFLKSLQQVEH